MRGPACGLIALSALLAGTPPLMADAYRYRIDPEHFSVAFAATHIGYAAAQGLFLRGDGSFVFDETVPAVRDLEISIEAGSIFTNHPARDDHLRGPDFLDAAPHPLIRFVMTKAEPRGARTGRLTGDLTLRGVTRPVSVDVTWNKSGRYPYNDNYVIGISAEALVRRSEWGMSYAVENGWVADEIPIRIELEAIRLPGAAR